MKYKTRKIPGAPDWMPEGVVCRCWDYHPSKAVEDLIFGYKDDDRYSFVGLRNMYICAEPIPAWEPVPGEEYCAFWDDTYVDFTIARFGSKVGNRFSTSMQALYDHIARIKGVDCACSLEELKQRTDWV